MKFIKLYLCFNLIIDRGFHCQISNNLLLERLKNEYLIEKIIRDMISECSCAAEEQEPDS